MDIVLKGTWISSLNNLSKWEGTRGPLLWQACWQGGLLILAVWILTRVGSRLPASLRHACWWLACVKLLLGLAWISSVRLPLLSARTPPAQAAMSAPMPTTRPRLSASASMPRLYGRATTGAQNATPDVVASSSGTAASSVRSLLLACSLLLWPLGALFCLAAMWRQWHSIRRIVRQAEPVNDSALMLQAREIAGLLYLRRLPRLLAVDDLASPFVAGLWRPVLVVGRAQLQRLSEPELRALLAHELAHLKRGDLWLALVPALAQTLFWFYPPAWLACREAYLACEAACDARAVHVTQTAPDVYGALLLKLGTYRTPPRMVAALGVSSHFDTLKRRIVMLQTSASTSRRRLLIGFGLLAMGGLVTLVPWKLVAAPTRHALQKDEAKPLYNAGSHTDWTDISLQTQNLDFSHGLQGWRKLETVGNSGAIFTTLQKIR